ncbi:MAG: PAS domain S-box protein, partial [Gammaproteobacteria bacterium]|nr:PAS domain S-box protein [Gammaproteobacteria bacterium]
MPVRIEKSGLLKELERDFFELAGDAMLIVDLDDACIVDANQAACELYGYAWGDLHNHSITDLDVIEDQAMVLERITRLKQEGRSRFESIHKSKNGELIPVEINVRIVRNEGRTYALSICRDISEFKRISADLQRRERQLAEAQSIAHIGSWEYNPSTRRLAWSVEMFRIYGVNPETHPPSVDGMMALVHMDDRPTMRTWINDCAAGRRPHALEFRILRPDGEMRYMEGHGHLVTNERGRPSYLAGTCQDVTERKSSELKLADTMLMLREKEFNKSRFFAAAGHDLRQPLTAANLFIGALKTTELTPKQRKIVSHLDQAMTNFNELLSSLLNISRLDAGVITPEHRAISITVLFSWLSNSFAQLAHQKDIDFTIRPPVRWDTHILGDSNLIKTALSNLVSNAIKFATGGKVLICARARGNGVLLQVRDNGPGIPAASIASVFDEFVQLNNPQRDMSKGVGLGLSIAKRALSLLNSELICRSRTGARSGTVFEFSLPSANLAEHAAETGGLAIQFAREQCESFVRGKRFVIVEDDRLIAEAFDLSLRRMGGFVRRFSNAEDAISQADIDKTDCYIV